MEAINEILSFLSQSSQGLFAFGIIIIGVWVAGFMAHRCVTQQVEEVERNLRREFQQKFAEIQTPQRVVQAWPEAVLEEIMNRH